MKQIERKTDSNPLLDNPKTYYQDDEGNQYRRLSAGLAFPTGDQPGFLVVFVEDRQEDPVMEKHHIRVAIEYENADIIGLLERAFAFRNRYAVGEWYADTQNRGTMDFVHEFNKTVTHRNRLRVYNAAFADDPGNLGYFINLIKAKTRPAKKYLHLGMNSSVFQVLESLPPEVPKRPAQDYPRIAASGFALVQLNSEPVDNSGPEAARRERIARRDSVRI